MMTTDETFAIVGASLAGAKAAQTLREEGFDGRVVLLGTETHRPYERPPLSKAYLGGTAGRDTVFVHPADWYAEQRVDLRLGATVTGIDRQAHDLTVADGSHLAYSKLLLTVGSSPRRLAVPGGDLDGVHYLRTLDDSDQLRTLFGSAARIAVIGAGWIGLEAAAAARDAGLQVTVLETAALPLLRVLGPELAEVFADLHREHGVDLRLGVELAELLGKGGQVSGVRLGDGSVVDADAVIVGIGVVPNTGLALAAGLEVDNGICVDERLATSDPDIYAAGDVANAYHPHLGRHLRVEHWANALHAGPTAARAMLGADAIDDRLPYFFTDQYDLGMEYCGHAEPGGYDQVVVRGDLAGREFIAFWLAADRVIAGMNVNTWDVTDDIDHLIRSRAVVDPARLADPAFALTDLSSATAAELPGRRAARWTALTDRA
jgi:3-phenylpropionate/trans-cinnamate dioxygenase ferredoxin reductase component